MFFLHSSFSAAFSVENRTDYLYFIYKTNFPIEPFRVQKHFITYEDESDWGWWWRCFKPAVWLKLNSQSLCNILSPTALHVHAASPFLGKTQKHSGGGGTTQSLDCLKFGEAASRGCSKEWKHKTESCRPRGLILTSCQPSSSLYPWHNRRPMVWNLNGEQIQLPLQNFELLSQTQTGWGGEIRAGLIIGTNRYSNANILQLGNHLLLHHIPHLSQLVRGWLFL